MRNLELKAKYPNLTRAEEITAELGATFQWRKRQIDTYFKVPNGRLKLREADGEDAELIGYFRPDHSEVRESRYERVAIRDSESLKEMLTETLGVVVVVSKVRKLYLYDIVRIHLDEVEGFGNFVEFEGVLKEGEDEAATLTALQNLKEKYEITDLDLVSTSYSDLMIQAGDFF